MDNLLNTLLNHLIDINDPKNIEILQNYQQFQQIIKSSMDGPNKVVYIERLLRNIKQDSLHQDFSKTQSFSDKKASNQPILRHTNSERILHQKQSNRFNNSIVLVETKLFNKKFLERSNEIEQMLASYEKGLN